jgi:type IV pilus assembly protein PilN
MPTINLRPWREELRAERQKQFITVLVGILIIACGLVFLWKGNVDSGIEFQNSRNAYMQSSMKELDKKIAEIKKLKSQKKQLLDRMKVIQDLQGTRPVIVRVFDELVRTLPDGLYYESLKRTDEELSIKGLAESNNRISGLMRNFEMSDWFSSPNLTAVSSVKGNDSLNKFSMSAKQVTPTVAANKKGAK